MFLALKYQNKLFQEHKIEVGSFLYLRERSLSGLTEMHDIFGVNRSGKAPGKDSSLSDSYSQT